MSSNIEILESLAKRKLRNIFQAYIPENGLSNITLPNTRSPEYRLMGLNYTSNNWINMLWNFVYYVKIDDSVSITNNSDFLRRIMEIDVLSIQVMALSVAANSFIPLHPSSDWLMLLGYSLTTEAADRSFLVNELSFFYKLLDDIIIYNQFYTFKTFAENDIRYLTYKWVDFCYSYRAHESSPDINDLRAAYVKIVYDYNQVIEKESRTVNIICGESFPEHAYGAFMRNFYNEKLDQYTIFTISDNNEYRTIKVSGDKPISDIIPFFTISLISRTSVDYETLMSRLRKIYTCRTITESNTSNNKLLAFTNPTTQVLLGLSIPKSDMWKETSQYPLNNTELKAINDYTDVLSKTKMNIVGRTESGNIFYSHIPNPLCVNVPEASDWVVDHNAFAYNPRLYTSNLKSLFKTDTPPLFYRAINGVEKQTISDTNFAKYILDGGAVNKSSPTPANIRAKDYGKKMLVTNAELDKLTRKKDGGKFGEFLERTFRYSAIKNNSQIRILVGSSGAGKSTTIASALYVSTLQPNLYTQNLNTVTPQIDKPDPSRERLPKVSLTNPYFAIDTFKVIPSADNSCKSIMKASTENETSSRNFNLWNTLLITSTSSLSRYYHLIASKSFTIVDTMGFENVAINRRGKTVLINPIDLILYPILTSETLKLDNFSIPTSIASGTVTPWEIPDYHKRVMELVDSFTSLLKVTRQLEDGKLNILPFFQLDPNSEAYKAINKNEIISFLLEYNRPRYRTWLKSKSDPITIERLEKAMMYDVDVTLLFNKDVNRRRRDIQVFNLLKIFSSVSVIHPSISSLITLDHILMSSS